jgi:hypothetical protein
MSKEDKISRSQNVKLILCNGNHLANYKGCRVYKKQQKNMFPAFRKKTIISSPPLAEKMQSESNKKLFISSSSKNSTLTKCHSIKQYIKNCTRIVKKYSRIW